MILFFSGTGNSEYVAKRIAQQINEEAVNLFEKIREKDYSDMFSDRPWVIVTPTYAWRIPHILHNWIEKTNLTGNKKIYFIMTCGGSIGNSSKYIKTLCASKNMKYLGCFPIVMPENYIALAPAPARKEALNIIRKAEGKMDKIAQLINQGKPFPQITITMKDRINSGIINDLYYPIFVHSKKFYATNACISCGKCVEVCPLNNIHLENKKPSWGKHCTHCMACICRCPKEAIEYGKRSVGRIRYTCPK